ncbi:MAG: RluA family pseudouridine synthase [Alphaproteobacteria bacterium]|nr:RluA family pseudouridine synthase [Alphaproteobacteria bacterium]MCB9929802.1 RluA family pseudouridine synthase [Alphaproteobacteria bacterium]
MTSRVQTLTISEQEADQRLDRWFQKRFPTLSYGHLQKLLRSGQIRVDGKRAKASDRLAEGAAVRVPPLGEADDASERQAPRVSDADAAFIRSLVIYEDADIIALNKPAGLAVQGGTKTRRHVDGMLPALAGRDGERPRLVHRLDRDTSGVLVLGRTAQATRALNDAFRLREMQKLYWAITVGILKPADGFIDLPLSKQGDVYEKMSEDHDGQRAITDYRTVEQASRRLAWVALAPRTGRTHQLRAHMAAKGKPILGDTKYGEHADGMADGLVEALDVAPGLHLHARALWLPPFGRRKGETHLVAPPPEHFLHTLRALDFNPENPLADEPIPNMREEYRHAVMAREKKKRR